MDTSVINVVIGLVFIYLIYSLLATTVQESISTALQRRAGTLFDGIKSMLTNTKKDKGVVVNFLEYIFVTSSRNFRLWLHKMFTGKRPVTLYSKFYEHPIIKNYGENLLFKKPSYLTPENFSSILIETLKNIDPANKNNTATFEMIRAATENAASGIDAETRSILIYHLNEAAGDLDVFKYRLEKWYNDTMDRVSGWYKRNTQFYLLVVGLFMAVSLNVDSIQITNYLSDNKEAREQLAAMGVAAASNPHNSGTDSITREAMDSIRANISKVNTLVGLGWGDYGRSDTAYRNYILSDSVYTPWYLFGRDTTDIYKAYRQNLHKADSVYTGDSMGLCKKLLSDASLTNADVDRKMDSLSALKDSIISQTRFALLYGDDNFHNSLRRKYVFYSAFHWKKFLGFLITAFAISLGAPFWFDLLNKFISLRTAVKTVNSSGSTTRNNTSGSDEIDG